MTGNHRQNGNGAKPEVQPDLFSTVPAFPGFDFLSANFTYTPNQFFDVCLPHYSRGVVRLVAYMIRQTLGYCDPSGAPQRTRLQVSWSDIEREAGLSRRAIPEALAEAIKGDFIVCLSPGVRDMKGARAQSAVYSLKWDKRPEYIKDPRQFRGFFDGEGNRSDIPNQFFDHVIPNESLAVVKVVGTVLRYTVGYLNPRGGRRMEANLSYQFISDYAGISGRQHISAALDTALAAGYITRTAQGYFDRVTGKNSKPASYAVRWVATGTSSTTGAKRLPDDSSQNRGKKVTGTGAKREPDTQGKKVTSTNKTGNKNSKQQQATVAAEDLEGFELLKGTGFDDVAAARLATRGVEIIKRQIEWLPRRGAAQNPLGLLRKAIQEDWPEPVNKVATSQLSPDAPAVLFVKYAYAVIGGNEGQPVAEPSAADLAAGAPYVERLLASWPHPDLVPEWGQAFGRLCRAAFETRGRPSIVSLASLIRSYGDEYAMRHEQARKNRIMTVRTALRAQREEEMKPRWVEYVRAQEAEVREARPEEYAAFEAHRAEERQRYFESMPEGGIRRAALEAHDSERVRLQTFADWFRADVLDFWAWDQQVNGELVV